MKTENNVGDLPQLPSDDKQDELNLEKNGTPRKDVKSCSVCNNEKPLGDFYSKGGRTDSACKACQKKKKKTKYVANKNQDVVAGLTAILGITTQALGKRIRSEIERLDEVIVWLQKSKR